MSTPEAGLRRIPRQARARELVEAIVEAGLCVLREEGPEALTTRRIAERAGVSIGSLYQYFSDKEAILEVVYRRHGERFWDAAIALVPTVAAGSLAEAITLIAETAIDRHRRLYDLHPQFYFKRAARFALSTFNPQSHEPATRFITMILECHRDGLAIRSPERAAFMMTRLLGAFLVRTLYERPHYLSDPSFLEDVVRTLRGLLVAEPRQESRTPAAGS